MRREDDDNWNRFARDMILLFSPWKHVRKIWNVFPGAAESELHCVWGCKYAGEYSERSWGTASVFRMQEHIARTISRLKRNLTRELVFKGFLLLFYITAVKHPSRVMFSFPHGQVFIFLSGFCMKNNDFADTSYFLGGKGEEKIAFAFFYLNNIEETFSTTCKNLQLNL